MYVTVLPDCPLSALRRGVFPERLCASFARAAGDACARHVRAGGSLAALSEDLSRIQNGRIALYPEPHPVQTAPWPDRHRLENDLLSLAAAWSFALPSPLLRLRFLVAFARHMSARDPAWRAWVRLWNARLLAEKAYHHHRALERVLHDLPAADAEGNRGCWSPDPTLPMAELRRALTRAAATAPLNHSRRASVFVTTLQGETVVVKHFAPNPQSWKRRLEISRARRAWAGSRILETCGLRCPHALGWLEVLHGDEVTDAWFISRHIPGLVTLRSSFRHHYYRMTPAERGELRHRLRAEIRHLHSFGLYHRDLKLGNILLSPGGDWYWIDLEDLRAGGIPFWTLVRTFYQLNGSIPRRLPREERVAFAAGFRRHFPLADNPLVLRFVEYKTRLRLQREVNRICRA